MLLKDVTSFESLFARAYTAGADRQNLISLSWDVSGPCQAAKRVECSGIFTPKAEPARNQHGFSEALPRRYVDLDVPCRKCEACLRRRRFIWWMKAQAEIRTAPRTWFGTLTLSPDYHYLVQCRATARTPSFDQEDDAEQFRLRHREIGLELTKFLKRLRKAQGAGKLRSLIVAERHKNGLPHYHCLLHETDEAAPLRKLVLHQKWIFGFSSWKLVEKDAAGKAANYVAKYLAKDAVARVRASIGYGDPQYVLEHMTASEGQKIQGGAGGCAPRF